MEKSVRNVRLEGFGRAFVREMRVRQWTKNLFVFAALLFKGEVFLSWAAATAAVIFFAFSLTASGVYFWNDVFDVAKDRVNPAKCHRPIASGAISRRTGVIGAAVLALMGLGLAWCVAPACAAVILSYVVVNIAYTVRLKHVVIIDVMLVAYGFVARAVVGALAIHSGMTTWFLLCVMFLSLFLALGKRRHERFAVEEHLIEEGRRVLAFYNVAFLDQLMTIVAAALLICYALFAADPATQDGQAMALTIPLVVYGMFYYLYIVRVRHAGGAPDEALWRERPILLTVALYVLAVLVIRNI